MVVSIHFVEISTYGGKQISVGHSSSVACYHVTKVHTVNAFPERQ